VGHGAASSWSFRRKAGVKVRSPGGAELGPKAGGVCGKEDEEEEEDDEEGDDNNDEDDDEDDEDDDEDDEDDAPPPFPPPPPRSRWSILERGWLDDVAPLASAPHSSLSSLQKKRIVSVRSAPLHFIASASRWLS
jgi:hypothetical protein